MRGVTTICCAIVLGACLRRPAPPPLDAPSPPASQPSAPQPSAPPPPAGPRRLEFGTVLAAKNATLLHGDRTYLLELGDEWFAPAARGFTALPALRVAVRAAAERDDLRSHELAVAHTPVITLITKDATMSARVGAGAAAPEGTPKYIARLDGEDEAWITVPHGAIAPGLHWLTPGHAPRRLTPPPRSGPDVPGLSDIGVALCTDSVFSRVAGHGGDLVALVVECHRETPGRLVIWSTPDAPPREVVLPWTESTDGFVSYELQAGRARGIAIAGTWEGRPGVARQGAAGWTVASSDRQASLVSRFVLGDDERAWVLALEPGEASPDGPYLLLREEGERLERIELRSPEGELARPLDVAFDPASGVVVRAESGARGDGDDWLFFERPGVALPMDRASP